MTAITIHRADYSGERMPPHARILNETLRDSRLSFAARGLLGYLLTHTNKWKVTDKELAKQGLGKDAVKTVTAELERYGYLKRIPQGRVRGRYTSAAWAVCEYPGADHRSGQTANGETDHGATAADEPPTVNPPESEESISETSSQKDQSSESSSPEGHAPDDMQPEERDLIMVYSENFGYCNGETPAVVAEFRRLRLDGAKVVLERCKNSEKARTEGVSWTYVLKSLKHEPLRTTPPGSAPPPSLVPDWYMPGDVRRRGLWPMEYDAMIAVASAKGIPLLERDAWARDEIRKTFCKEEVQA